MYIQHLSLVKTKTGEGVFTNTRIPANSIILEFGGELHDLNKVPGLEVLQVGPNYYLSPSGNIGDKIRHSCNPNCYLHVVGKRAFLYSTYVIEPNVELTFDYSTSSSDTLDTWQMQCNCGSFNCRKIISGLQYLSEAQKEEYRKKGLIPLFMTMNIFMKK